MHTGLHGLPGTSFLGLSQIRRPCKTLYSLFAAGAETRLTCRSWCGQGVQPFSPGAAESVRMGSHRPPIRRVGPVTFGLTPVTPVTAMTDTESYGGSLSLSLSVSRIV